MKSSLQEKAVPALSLRRQWREIRDTKSMRNRDIAAFLGVSEGELVASTCGEETTRLQGPFGKLIEQLPALGNVMALTRNESAVHEKIGTYENGSITGPMGLVLGEAIDLRLFMSQWKFGYALNEKKHDSTLHSPQFFDGSGTAVHKIFLRHDSNRDAFDALVQRYGAPSQEAGEIVAASAEDVAENSDEAIDQPGFRIAWEALQDTHEFFGMLRRFKVSRTQALRLADPQYAWPVQTSSLRTALERASASGLPTMVFVGNAGCIQIHTGSVNNVVVRDRWLNVMDPGFNLHMREDHIASAWVVCKPTSEGIVTSLELFDDKGRNLALIFGKRKPGIPELENWRALAAQLPRANTETLQ
ncbi:MAG: ChuX/HutX family heme-like substrate-binding protein [Betaproteobacteria bacterium]